MNTDPNPNFQYLMPEDEEEEYEEDAGDEMVDMEEDDDEAQRENDQLQANKVGGMALMMANENEADENAQPILNKGQMHQGMPQQPIMTTQL